jgi:YD repeat-containing protein
LGFTSRTTYDKVSNTIATTDALNRTMRYVFDARNRQVEVIDPLNQSETTTYDALGNVLSATDALGQTTRFVYDNRNRQTEAIDALGGRTKTEYDAVGNVLAVIDPLGKATRYEYDSINRRTLVIDAFGQYTSTQYDPVGNVLSVRDHGDNTTNYQYDTNNRLTRETTPLGADILYGYDAVGNLRFARHQLYLSGSNNGVVSQPLAEVFNYDYDPLNRRIRESWLLDDDILDGQLRYGTVRTIDSSFDPVGQLTQISDPDSTYKYTYDLDGRLSTLSNEGSVGVPTVLMSYGYDPVGNSISRTEAIDGTLNRTITSSFDDLNRLGSLQQSGGVEKRVDYTYNAIGQPVMQKRYADLAALQPVGETTMSYDPLHRLRNLNHSRGNGRIAFYDYVYDADSRITGITSNDGTASYAYDDTDQLTGVRYSDSDPSLVDETYSYDPNGNRTNSGYVTGSGNLLLSDGRNDYLYDALGRRVKSTDSSSGMSTDYTWDFRNRLTGTVTKDSDAVVMHAADYVYDVDNLRIASTVDPDGADLASATVERYIYGQNQNIALQFDDSAVLTNRYLHGNSIDAILADESNGSTLWTFTDHQNSVRDLGDDSGAAGQTHKNRALG